MVRGYPRRWNSFLVLLFLLGIALRLGYLSVGEVLTAPPKNDGISYDIIAYNLVQGNGFSLEQPTAFRPPAYPLFLAGLYLFASKSYILVHLVQAVLGAVTPLLLFGAVLRSYPGRYTLAFLAAAILAIQIGRAHV